MNPPARLPHLVRLGHRGRTWLLFGLCLAVALVGLGWITATTLTLDHAQRAAEQQAVVEENARLALWRMDSAVLPILLTENARPYYQYSPTYHIPRNLADPDHQLPPELASVLGASPLVEQQVPFMRVYFQIDPQGDVISPQLPGVMNKQVQPDSPVNGSPMLTRQVQVLNDFQDQIQIAAVREQLNAGPVYNNSLVSDPPPPVEPAPNAAAAVKAYAGKAQSYQQKLNTSDYEARVKALAGVSQNRAPELPNGAEQPASSSWTGWPSSTPLPEQPPPPPVNDLPDEAAGQQLAREPAPNSAPDATISLPPNSAADPPPEPAEPPHRPQENAAEPSPQTTQTEQTAQDAQTGQTAQGQQDEPVAPLANIYTAKNWHQPAAPADDPAQVGTITPLWQNNRLLLTRQVKVHNQAFIQGAWVDWPALEKKLRADVQDLLPNATLEPWPPANTTATAAIAAVPAAIPADPHQLALLPVRLVPGELSAVAGGGLSPVEQTLLIAWIAILLAGAAVGALLYGVLALSERRATFVSAVTHELRTPLTTFRMYTEMLSAGMVRDEAKKAKYLGTMRAEAVRLGHLVENVLAYARLERSGHNNPQAGRIEAIPVAALFERLQEHLRERAEQAGMQLTIDLNGPGVATAAVRADPGAVEQILFNLVDNACKYGQTPDAPEGAARGKITIGANRTERQVVVRVLDAGAGIAADQQPRLFQPFTRSAEVAANSQTRTPGVGLGLALCRRLARAMRGDLTWDRGITPGTCFVLTLPRAES